MAEPEPITPLPVDSARVLLLPLTSRDAEAIGKLLCEAVLHCVVCRTMDELCAQIDRGAGAVLVSEEALVADSTPLRRRLGEQPVWSDLPVIVLSRSGVESPALASLVSDLGNVSVLERPARVSTLLSVIHTALRARLRQYQVRDHLIERLAAEDALRLSREQTAIVIRGANVGLWHCVLPFNDLIWDETVKSHFHLSPDAAVTIDTFFDRLHPDDREPTRQAIEKSIEEHHSYDVEYRTVSPQNGSCKWIRAMGRCFYDDAGSPVRFDGITVDLTSRAVAEQRLREETNAVETINRVGQLVAAELNLETLVQTVTDATTELTEAEFGAFFYNVTSEEGKSYALFCVSGVPRERFSGFPMPRATELFGATFRGEGVVRLDDVTLDARFGKNPPYHGMPPGHLPVRSYLAVPVISRTGEVLGGLFFGHSRAGVFHARSERIVAGIAAQAAVAIDNANLYRALRDADRRKDEFLAMLAHELRNPLAPVRTGLELLSLAGVDHECVPIMRQQVDHLVRLVDDLLDVSRIMRGKIHLRTEVVDLISIAERAIETIRPAVAAHQHVLTVSTPPGPLWVEGDAVRLAQVTINLLNNAIKYTDNGGRIQLTIGQDDSAVSLSVRDNGVGLDAELLPRVFDLFTQADRSLERSEGGLGIGLTLVKNLVDLHRGEVTAHSGGVGQGSEFTVRLPHSPAPGPVAQPVLPAPVQRPRRVLLVDDNIGTTRIQMILLQKLGDHEVRVAHDGPAALKLAEEFEPDIILLDIGLPVMNGYDVARRLRSQPRFQRTVLVALTGYGTDEDRRRTSEAGFDLHLVKPPSLEAFRQVLATAPASR